MDPDKQRHSVLIVSALKSLTSSPTVSNLFLLRDLVVISSLMLAWSHPKNGVSDPIFLMIHSWIRKKNRWWRWGYAITLTVIERVKSQSNWANQQVNRFLKRRVSPANRPLVKTLGLALGVVIGLYFVQVTLLLGILWVGALTIKVAFSLPLPQRREERLIPEREPGEL
jgi:hypothetical protein